MPVTLANLRTRAKRRSDMESTSFVADAEWTDLINEAYLELWDLVLAAHADHFIASANFTLTSSVNTYTISTAIYNVRSVLRNPGLETEYEVPQWQWNERGQHAAIAYRLHGTTLEVLPKTSAAGDYRIYYEQSCTKLSADGDEITAAIEKYADYIVCAAAIKALQKEESDTATLERERKRIEERIRAASKTRNASRPERIGDVYMSDPEDPWA